MAIYSNEPAGAAKSGYEAKLTCLAVVVVLLCLLKNAGYENIIQLDIKESAQYLMTILTDEKYPTPEMHLIIAPNRLYSKTKTKTSQKAK